MFPPALKEGERVSVACSVRSGDRPVQFQWKKDGQEIVENSNVGMQTVKDTSLLTIESVTAKSSGNYTCIVSNKFGSDQFTAALTVTGMHKKYVYIYYVTCDCFKYC